jgi:hypothetical protein
MSILRSIRWCQFGGQNQSQNSAYIYQAEFEYLKYSLGAAGGVR